MFFSIFALTLTNFCPILAKVPPKRVFFSISAKAYQKGCFRYFALTKALPKKRVFFSISDLILTKVVPKRVFFYLNQIPIFALVLAKALPKRVFYYIFALIISNQKGCFILPYQKKRCFFLYFALTLSKALLFFHYFCPNPNILPLFEPKPYQKFFYSTILPLF